MLSAHLPAPEKTGARARPNGGLPFEQVAGPWPDRPSRVRLRPRSSGNQSLGRNGGDC